jgi:hypothetical protein
VAGRIKEQLNQLKKKSLIMKRSCDKKDLAKTSSSKFKEDKLVFESTVKKVSSVIKQHPHPVKFIISRDDLLNSSDHQSNISDFKDEVIDIKSKES